ncbi:MAG: hypothetical protein PUB10_07920 [Clostridiales bacterium]|nr:hypothetical protein [Clostridiales bacterium]
MSNAFGKIMEIFLFAILVFLMPLQYEAQKQDGIIQNYVLQETAYLVDSAANLGYLNRNMVEIYEKKLFRTGYSYDIVFTVHKQKILLSDDTEESTVTQREDYEYVDNYVIWEALYGENGEFKMKQGDFLSIQVSSRGKTYYEQIRSFFLMRSMKNSGIFVQYGGMIKDETS